MVWSSHLFKSFPQFVTIHIVKVYSIVDETEVDVFLEFPCFLYDPADAGYLVLLPFLNPEIGRASCRERV